LVSALSGIVSGTTSVLLVLVGFVVGFVLLSNSLKAPKENVQKRADACVLEFPNMVSKLALMINSGMILREAWFLVAESTTGELHELMEYSCDLMNNGKSDIDAVYEFGIKSGSKEMKKFSSIITQGLEKGNSELSNMLMQQSSELWELKRQKLLQKGDVAATKLVVPTTLMFAGIILVVVSTALSGMSI
jgi:tight adherence protein C